MPHRIFQEIVKNLAQKGICINFDITEGYPDGYRTQVKQGCCTGNGIVHILPLRCLDPDILVMFCKRNLLVYPLCCSGLFSDKTKQFFIGSNFFG